MKKMAVIAIIGLLLSIPVYRVLAETCSCAAIDGSCSASISCAGGCIAYCPSGGCYAKCSSGRHFLEDLSQEVTVEMRDGSSRQLSSELARITGEEIVISPNKPSETYTLDFKNALLWDVLEVLSARGKVQIAGEDFGKLLRIRKAFLSGEKMSVCIHKTPVKYIIDQLASLSGEQIHVSSGNRNTLITLSLKDVTLKEIVAKISEQTGAQIEGLDSTGR
jgi:type II secretory pathway component GspD/PulD (secretin)